MAHRALAFVVLFALVLMPRAAHALAQSKHRSLSVNACEKAHLPEDFCEWVGAAAFNVDHEEWDVLAAHAQPEAGQSRCDAANATLARVHALGLDVEAAIVGSPQTDAGKAALASALGRALHTIQDNCAHSGIPNIQHAWASLSDTCEGTDQSPDIQPEALSCATEESAAVLALVSDALAQSAVSGSLLAGLGQTGPTLWPSRGGVCEFLQSAQSWDGVDQRWDNAQVRPALREALATALTSGNAPADVCATGPNAIDNPAAAPPADVSVPPMWCGAVALYCAGKTDDASQLPPWESKTAPASQPESSSGGGCALQASPTGAGAWALGGLALAALAWRRRRDR